MTLSVKFPFMKCELTVKVPLHEEDNLCDIKERIFELYSNTMGYSHARQCIGSPRQIMLKDINGWEVVSDRHFKKAYPYGLIAEF